jgi:phosphoribosylamine---glycine ligase
MNILVIGSGGREHSLVWKLGQSNLVKSIFVAPGNPGIMQTVKTKNVIPNNSTDIKELLRFSIKEKIDITIVGSEELLEKDIVDAFRNSGLKIIGPCGHDAQVETSKAFAKYLMQQELIPTASFKTFSDFRKATSYLDTVNFPRVIKADGLAKGKGVYICQTLTDGKCALKSVMIDKIHGDAGRVVIVESCLEGIEYSAHMLISGKAVLPFPMSQDYKTFNGQNTGGMGAIAPVLTESRNFLDEMTNMFARPVVNYLARLKGHTPIYDLAMFLYPGIMITNCGPEALEYNVRPGDPEAQVYMRLLKSDLAELLLACVENKLQNIKIEWHDKYAVCVVLVSDGYPDENKYKTGYQITGVTKANGIKGVKVFHAGTAYKDKKLVTNGGRVLNVTATGKTLKEARWLAYKGVDEIHFEGMQYREDIGLELSPYQST